MWLALLLVLPGKLAACGESVCRVDGWLLAADAATRLCGDTDELLVRLRDDGEADLWVFAFAQPDAVWPSSFLVVKEQHFGGVERGRVRVTRSNVFAFIAEMNALGRCVYGRSVLAAPRAHRD